MFIHSIIHSFLHLFIHLFTHPYTHSFIHALIHLFILGNGNTLQYFCRENPTDRGTCRAAVQGVAECRARLSGRHSLTHSICARPPARKAQPCSTDMALELARGPRSVPPPLRCHCDGAREGDVGWLQECGQGKAPPHPAITTASNSKLPCTSQDSWGLCEDQKGRLRGVQVKTDVPGQSRRG